jgi:hypothetical protein
MPSPDTGRLAALPKLGIGLSFQATLQEFVRQHADAFDFLEIIPDSLWTDRGPDAAQRYVENPEAARFLTQVAQHKPVILHSIGLSIGSADYFDTEHIAQIGRWRQRYTSPWHSDHLSFNRLDQITGHGIDVGFTMPVPYDQEVLDMLVERVNYVQDHVPAPFLLENNVYYFEIPDQEMIEPEFLNALSQRTGCGLLLDIHNVYTNARNHGFDPMTFFSDLDLTRVVELHIGGGMIKEEFYLDSHSGPAPDEVWDLLEQVLPQAPNAAGIVFEVFGTYYPQMGPVRLRQELETARAIWDSVHPNGG